MDHGTMCGELVVIPLSGSWWCLLLLDLSPNQVACISYVFLDIQHQVWYTDFPSYKEWRILVKEIPQTWVRLLHHTLAGYLPACSIGTNRKSLREVQLEPIMFVSWYCPRPFQSLGLRAPPASDRCSSLSWSGLLPCWWSRMNAIVMYLREVAECFDDWIGKSPIQQCSFSCSFASSGSLFHSLRALPSIKWHMLIVDGL